jgi:hypothetical protein
MKQTMKSSISILLSLLLIAASAMRAEEAEWRTWTSSAGTRIEAKLVEQTSTSVVLVQKGNGRRLTVKLSQLSAADRDFLTELRKSDDDMGFDKPTKKSDVAPTTIEGVDAKPGETSGEIACASNPNWTYHLYLPKFFHTGKKWPVWFIMSPGGGTGGGALDRYKEGADKLGCILALSVQSKNGFAESDKAIETMAEDVFKRLPVIEELGFTSGFSGGARMAYLLAERDKRIAGVLACGSGGGVYLSADEFREAKLRKSTYVCSLMGTNCFNRNEAVRSHQDFPDNYRLRFFEGGHAWADSKLIAEGMAIVLGEGLKSSRNRDLEEIKRDYARAMFTWATKLQTDEPWEAVFWAKFLAGFDGDGDVSSDAKKLADDLEDDDERVEAAADAQEVIDKFCKKHLDKPGSSEDAKKPDESRKAEADKLADKMGELPHADLLRKLGEPAK